MPILVGTASWTDKTLIACGRFYPKDAKTAEARLRHYASVFPLVEVDSSYYAMPSPSTAQLWADSAVALLKSRGAIDIRALVLVAAPEGIAALTAAHPDVRCWTAAIDSHLNENGYIIPGLGDAGDRIFGTR